MLSRFLEFDKVTEVCCCRQLTVLLLQESVQLQSVLFMNRTVILLSYPKLRIRQKTRKKQQREIDDPQMGG